MHPTTGWAPSIIGTYVTSVVGNGIASSRSSRKDASFVYSSTVVAWVPLQVEEDADAAV